MAIVDGRTVLDTGEALTNWVDDAGAGFPGGINSDTYIKGSGSVAERVSNSTLGFFVDAGSAQDWTNNTFYFWYNVSTAGLLDTLANGGVRMRFCGSTISQWFEVYLAGSDTYSGGWKMAVVNIDEARAAAVASDPNTGTNGTVPAVSAIQYVGIFFDMANMVSGNVDNCFVDHCWRLPPDTPGLRVEGNNSSSPWTWQDIVDAADPGDTTKAWGTAFRRDGVVFINTPIQFGTDDTSNADDQFEDTNEVVFFEDHRVPDDFYLLEVLGASGGTASQLFRLGTRSGTGATSTGNQGGVIGAPLTGFAPRWNFTSTDADVEVCELLGVTMSHVNVMDISQDNDEVRSCVLVDFTSVLHSGTPAAGAGTGDFSKNTVVDSNTADGVALIETDDLAAIVENSFTFSDGHAIEVTALGGGGSPYTFSGNDFTGFGADGTTDAAILADNLTFTISVAGGGSTPTVREINSADVTVENNISITVAGLKDDTEVAAYETIGEVFIADAEPATDGTVDDRSFTFSAAAGIDVYITVFNLNWSLPPENRINLTVPTGDTTIPVSQVRDRVYDNP